MFKSIFAKYVTAFMLIVLSSFLVIIVIISSIIVSFSTDQKAEIMENSAKASSTYIEGLFDISATDSVSDVIEASFEESKEMLGAITGNARDITVLVSDNSGNIVMAVGNNESEITEGKSIPKALMDEVNSGNEISGSERLKGVFESEHLIYAAPVYNSDDAVCGTVFVCAESRVLSELLDVIVKAVVVSIY